MSEIDPPTDDGPDFEEIFPDLDVAGRLVAAAANGDEDAVGKLRDSDADWWNVAWTLALLIRGLRNGEPATVELVDSLLKPPDS